MSDPDRAVYRIFDLGEGGVGALVGPKSLLRGAGLFFSGVLPGTPVGNVKQMPGAFVLRDGRVLAEFRHQSVADKPNWLDLLERAARA